MKTGLIYKAINTINNKVYVGQTRNFNKRKSGHIRRSFKENSVDYNCHFHRAIRKYGINVFKWEILCDKIPIEYLNEYERFYICFEGAFSCGYNSTSGGDDNKEISDQVRLKMSNSHLGKSHSQETKNLMSLNHADVSGENNPNFHRKFSQTTKQRMSQAHIGKKLSENIKRKISEIHKGRIFSAEAKRNMSIAAKKRCTLKKENINECP